MGESSRSQDEWKPTISAPDLDFVEIASLRDGQGGGTLRAAFCFAGAVITIGSGRFIRRVAAGVAGAGLLVSLSVPDEASLNSTFAELTQGGSPATWKNFSGPVFERSDGVQVGLRSYSKSGGPTIDIRMPDGTYYRIHVG